MASPLDDGEAFGLFSHDFGEGGICALSSRPSLNQDHGSHISRCNVSPCPSHFWSVLRMLQRVEEAN